MTARGGWAGLDPCVHCGFCLPACPTYVVTGDESDSPRGRIVLMRALESGELTSADDGLVEHLDACLGCRGCEPVCPSGVEYGRGLEAARTKLAAERGLGPLARGVLAVFAREYLWRPAFTVGRWLRDSGVARAVPATSRGGAALAMLAATRAGTPSRATRSSARSPRPASATVALFTGCVMDTLFRHVHHATREALEANGYDVVVPGGQTCCGALHDHAGDRATAQELARRNVAALAESADYIVVNSAGCGALLKDYVHLLEGGREHGASDPSAAARLSSKVRDVSELLAAAGPRPGRSLDLDVVYDAPCHLQHAQRVHAEPLQMLESIPGLRVRLLPGSSMCCGSAGVYSLLQPAMSARVLAAKVAEIAAAEPRPDAVVTGNPGCIMQIGAGLRAAGLDIPVMHPVELVALSYR